MAEQSAPTRRPALPLAAQTRVWHGLIGMLIAPTVLFMAATGILQVYSLHEAHGAYTPPALIELFGRLHKDQVLQGPARHEDHDQHAAEPHHDEDHVAPPQASPIARLARTVLKAFLAGAAGLLIVSTCFGWDCSSASAAAHTLRS